MRIQGFGSMPQAVAKPIKAVALTKDENQFFDFEKEKVQVLTLDQLKMTNKENRGDDRSCPHGIYHYVLIEKMLEMCNKHGYDAEVYDLFATNNKDKQTPGVSLYPELEKKYGERAIQAHTLRRVYANIRLKNFDTPELTTNLAVSYTQKGIQVGFGAMVKVCHNQNIMGTGNFASTYSSGMRYANGNVEKTDLNGILGIVGGWLGNAEHKMINDINTIERMKQVMLSAEQLYTILGLLQTIRVTHDTEIKKIRNSSGTYPLNNMQLNKFTENLLVKQHERGCISAWDFYNCATELYKPSVVDQNMVLPQALSMHQFMVENEIF